MVYCDLLAVGLEVKNYAFGTSVYIAALTNLWTAVWIEIDDWWSMVCVLYSAVQIYVLLHVGLAVLSSKYVWHSADSS